MVKKYITIRQNIKIVPLDEKTSPIIDDREDINSRADLYYLLKRLKPKERKIAEMISEGYTRREIIKSLRVGQHRIENLLKRLQKEIKLL